MPIVPCPVRLGSVKTGGVEAQLHQYTRERNLQKAEKLLKQGVNVDCVNNLGQTSLFCVSLLGFTAVAELLLQYGADPNHRCDDRSTPVHAAVFSCNMSLLSELLEAGGDLRLHDDQGRAPRDWAEIGAQKHGAKMVSFIKSYMSVMRSLSESQSHRDVSVTPTSSKTLLDFLRPDSDVFFNKKLTKKSSLSNIVQCYGFGKLCVEKPGMSVGVLASMPLISDSELLQTEDEALHSFPCGSFTKMTNYSWKGSRVTVKELQIDNTHQHAQKHGYLDLLITEQSFCCRLFHPHLLQMMAVSFSNDLKLNKLVYERVHVGSLYSLLYHKPAEFPVLQAYEALLLILQVCDALFYLHSRSLVLRSLSSHSVLIVHPGVAKVTGFGFMVPSGDCSPSSTPHIPVILYNWAAPEVIRGKSCTGKADLYSICALIQEIYTDSVPWGSVNPRWIKRAVDAGQALCVDPAVPQPYYNLLLNGLKPRAQERTCSLQHLRYTLRYHLKELSEREKRSEECPLLARSGLHRGSTEIWQNRGTENPDEQQVVDQDIQFQELDSFVEKQTKQKNSLRSLQNCLSADKLLQDISFRDTLCLDEWCLSPRPPSVVEEDMDEEEKLKERDVAIQSSNSDPIDAIAQNLKVCAMLVEEIESGFKRTKARMMGNACSSIQAVGPPSLTYIPPNLRLQRMEEEVTEFFSGEESFESSEVDDRKTREGRGQAVRFTEECDRFSQSSATQELMQNVHAERNWTSEVSAAVARTVQGFLSSATGMQLGSSDSEEVQEQPRLLMDTHDDSKLERLFKSFAGVHSESEESTDFHTISHIFTLPNFVMEEEDGSDSEDTQSPVEASSIFYTPKHNPPNNTDTEEELSQKSSSDDGLCVTTEVCRPNMTVETTLRAGEVSAAVALAVQGFLSSAAEVQLGSSDSEEVQEQLRLLMDTQDDGAGVHSESEESADFHTINHISTLPNTVMEAKHREEGGSDSEDTQSPVEASSIFYTPKHNPPNNTDTEEELSQKSSSGDGPDVTMEVCRPNMTVETTLRGEVSAAVAQTVQGFQGFAECQSSPEEPEHTEAESVPPSVHTTSHMADIDDLSSITCSPPQLQERMGQNGAPPSPRNSTPHSPHTHTGRGTLRRKVCVTPFIPHLQSLMETTAWGSTESPSHTDSYNTARLEHTDRSPAERGFPQRDSDTPSSGNQEFTTSSSVVRHSEEKKSQDHSDTLVTALECDTEVVQFSCNATKSAMDTERAHSSLDEVLESFLKTTEAKRTIKGAIVIIE